jgi:hypothetical protein
VHNANPNELIGDGFLEIFHDKFFILYFFGFQNLEFLFVFALLLMPVERFIVVAKLPVYHIFL